MRDVSPLILIVDDDPRSLNAMCTILSDAGYRIAAANGGPICFKILETMRPDLILCDVVMPELSGYEICRRLKQEPDTADIPLIFLTSRSSPDDTLAGFAAGAVDYVTKPFHAAELLARVKTHTEFKRSRDALFETGQRLTALNAEKDHLMGIVVHDLRNPLAAIATAQRMIRARAAEGELPSDKLLNLIEEAYLAADGLIQELLEMAELEQNQAPLQRESVDAVAFLQGVHDLFQPQASQRRLSLSYSHPDGPLPLRLHVPKMQRAIGNLLQNALKFTPADGGVSLILSAADDAIRIEVADTGIGIPAGLQAVLFDKFTAARRSGLAGERAHGLGMHITREIIRQHGGSITVDSELGQGTRFCMRLPREA